MVLLKSSLCGKYTVVRGEGNMKGSRGRETD